MIPAASHSPGRRLRRLTQGSALLALATAALAAAQSPPGAIVQPLDPDEGAELRGYLTTLASNPRSIEALIGAGRAALGSGDAEAAIAFFGRASELAPGDGQARAGMGSALAQLGRAEAAIELFDQATRLGVPESQIAGDRGLAWDLRGEPQRAQQDYNLALRRRDDPEIRRRLALSLAISGQREAALAAIDPQLRANDRAGWRVQAFILALTGDVAGARRTAAGVMPPGTAEAMNPFLDRLAGLSLSQKAMAVHLGHFPSAAGQYAGLARPAPVPARTPPVSTLQPSPPPRAAGSERQVAQLDTRWRAPDASGATRPVASPPPPPPATTLPPPPPPPPPSPPPPAATLPNVVTSGVLSPSTDRGATALPTISDPRPGAANATPSLPSPPPPPVISGQVEDSSAGATVQSLPVAPPPPPRPLPSSPPPPSRATPISPSADSGTLADIVAVVESLSEEESARPATPSRERASAAAERRPARPAPPAHPRRHWVQLGIGQDRSRLGTDFNRLRGEAPQQLRGRNPYVARLNQTNRLLVGPFASQAEAQRFVNVLAGAGVRAYAWTSAAGEQVDRLPVRR